MAPNLVTLVGTAAIVFGMAQYVVYDLSFDMDFSPAFYFCSAASLFVYQTFDAIDGK